MFFFFDWLGAIKCEVKSTRNSDKSGDYKTSSVVIKLLLPFRSISLLKAEVNFSS